ncbi:hypothetical protein cypCar_00032009 [Cyprinus carpio]|nr:hypothetical protein cypCar_00032009 [Cyprinus carpio]
MSSLITLSKSTKLNVPKLLLPLSTRVPVNITLTAQRGCYKWVSFKPETVRVYPLSALSPPALLPLSSCSQQCLVSALSSPQAVPLRTVVQAQDPVTGHILRCDVIINRIESIQVVTTIRQLFTNDPPLQLSVRAFDSEGNTFSCLAGLKFNWRLAKESDAIQAVRFVRHHDAGYAPPPHILSLEDAGQWGESVLLYGIHSGSALIKVSFLHPEHKHVEAASVTLFVIDRLHLSPVGDTYLLQGSTIRYTLWKTEQEGETEVTLSEEGYSLVVDGYKGRMYDHDIISVEQDTATVTALKLGHATLTVTHNNLPPQITSQLPRTSVYVVNPSYMTLSIKEEEDRWVLETGRQYYLTVRIHDNKGHVVHLSQNVVIVVEETEGLVTLESLSDPACHLLQTIMKGKTLIQALLYSIVSEDGECWPVIPPIRVQQEVEIYKPLTLQPSVIVFPWQPHNKLYQHNIQVEGGSGSVTWEVSDREIATVTVKGVVIAGKRRGHAEIRVSDSKNILHKVVGKSLVSEVLLSVGSSHEVIFEGGPQPWALAPLRFFSDVEVQPEGGVTVEVLSPAKAMPARYAYQVTCTAVGEQWLVFRCGNTPGPLNEILTVEESRVQVACGVPAGLSLSLLSSPSSPSSVHYSCTQPHYPCGLLSVSSTRDATLQLSVFDQKGVQFDNFTSCSVRWTSSDPGVLSLSPQFTMKVDDRLTQTGYKLHAWQVLQAHGQTGTVTVNATLTCPEMLTAPVSQCVNLRLVDDVQWTRHSVTLFNHPKVTENLTLIHGSGRFHAHLQDNQLASINQENSNVIQVSPLQTGSSVLMAHDLCLTSDPAVASFLVSDIKDFQIDFISNIEVRHSAVVRVRVLDSNNQPFLHHYLLLMNLMLIPSSSIISVEDMGPVDKYSVGFRVTGLTVGVVSFHLSAVDGHGFVISSSHKNVQVYPPFSLQPHKLTLAVGSVRQVKWEGGPHPQYGVKFSMSDSSIAVVTEIGLVRGVAVGVVKLRAAPQTQNKEASLIFLQDEVEVEVFNLTAVRIQAPLVTLSVGTEMPVYVMGSDSSQNPLSLGSVESGLSFHWSLSKAGVLEIKPRHAQVGVSVSPSHSFSVLVRARAPGRTSLKVCVQLQQIDTSNTSLSDHLTDEIQILVFEEMQLTAGSSESILMSPLSQYLLRSNKDSVCPVHYTFSRCVSGAGLVTIDNEGVLKTGPDTGLAVLEVYAMDICGINQTLLISVEVSTAWFVRILTVSSVNSDSDRALPAFPLGWSIRIRALYYDNMGRQFQSHNIQTLVTANRDDLVQLIVDKDSRSFLVQTASPGLTVLRVQGDTTNPFLSDYTPLFVMPAIPEPTGCLRSGDVICFSSPITDQQVEPASIPVFIPPADRLLINWPEASEYTVRVDLNTSAANTAQYSCRISVQPQSDSILHLLSTRSLSIHLSACLRTQLAPAALLSLPQTPHSFQSSLQLPYVPAFHCPVTKIKLSSQQPEAEITVFGTTDMLSTLRVQSDTPDIVLSDPVWSDEDPTLLLISVYPTLHFLDQVPSTASISLYTDLSPQKHIVLVTRVMDDPESGHLGTNSGHLFISVFALFAVLATAAALFIAYNTMLSLPQTVHAVLTPSTNTEDSQHFYLWLTPSLPKPKILQRKQWLWSTK